jgi:5-formyltetrahydrofolate cyclo-ligase
LNLAQEKKDLRQRMMAGREAALAAAGAFAGERLAERGLPIPMPGKGTVISAFHPYQTEISTLPLLSKLAAGGWVTALPVVIAKGQPLVFRAWKPGEPLVSGIWDIQIPPETSPEVVPDVLLVPLLAFDMQGYRLGYGGGFYDRTLARLRSLKPVTAIGIGFAAQQVDRVPHDELDQRVDYVMTEKATLACG